MSGQNVKSISLRDAHNHWLVKEDNAGEHIQSSTIHEKYMRIQTPEDNPNCDKLERDGSCRQVSLYVPETELLTALRSRLILPEERIRQRNGHCLCKILPVCPNSLIREYVKIHGERGNQADILDYLVQRYDKIIRAHGCHAAPSWEAAN